MSWRFARVFFFAGLTACSGALLPAVAQNRAPNFAEAQSVYESAFSVQQRLIFQVLMIAAGYYNGVPNESFNTRLFAGLQRFQAENGFRPNGVLGEGQVDRLFALASPMLNLWGFRKVTHPTRNVTIWVPLGLGLQASRSEQRLSYTDAQDRIRLSFISVPKADVEAVFSGLLGKLQQENAAIHYKALKDGWFVISATAVDGVDRYIRYHQDGPNVTGFVLSWNNARGNVSGERIAILMSASLWSNMTGAPFVDPPGPLEPRAATRSEPAPKDQPVMKPAPLAPATPPTPESKFSSGTGFFVTADGTFVTNAHVIESCDTVRVKTDDGTIQEGRVIAKDVANDLALLKLQKGPVKFASLRPGVRLGEGVAALDFPIPISCPARATSRWAT